MRLPRRFILGTILQAVLATVATAQPTITGVQDADRTRSGRVAITGTGFGTAGEVHIGGIPAWTSTWTDTRIVAYVPELSPLGSVPLQVIRGGMQSNELLLSVQARQPDGRVRWTFEADGNNLWWRPALAPDGTVYLHGSTATHGLVYSLAPDGALLWIRKVNGYPYVPPTAGPDGAVYVGSNGSIYRITPQGDIAWRYADSVSRGPRVAPTIGPGGLLYGAFEGGIGAFAMDPATGQLVWSNPGDPLLSDKKGEGTEARFGPSSPGGPVDQMYVSVDGGAGFYAFSLDGEQRFTASIGSIKGNAEVAVGADGTIYGPRASGLVVAALDPADGSTLWEYYPGPTEWATGTRNVEIGPDDMLYFVGSGAKLESFDPQSQSRRWQEFTPLDTLERPSVTPDGTTVVLAGADNDLTGNPGFVRAFTARNGRQLWSMDLPFQLSPGFRAYGTHHPRITPDGATAYVSTLTLAEWPLSSDPHSFLFAVELGPPACVSPPAEVSGVNQDANKVTLRWSSQGPGSSYDVARGDIGSLGSGAAAACRCSGELQTSCDDPDLPVPGSGFYYVVRAVNDCGHGPWGWSTVGLARNVDCP